MKNLSKIVLLLIFLIVSANGIFAQKNIVKFGLSEFPLSYERVITDRTSVQVGLWYFKMSNKGDLNLWRTQGAKIDYRNYTTTKPQGAPYGLYFGPLVSFRKSSFDYMDRVFCGCKPTPEQSELKKRVYNGSRELNVGMELGYQKIFWNKLSLDATFDYGIQFRQRIDHLDSEIGYEEGSYSSFPNISLKVGYAF